MTLADAAQDFLAQPRIAVAGVSRQTSQPANFIFRKLRAAGREVFPVNPATTEAEGVACYPDLRSIPGGVTAVVVVTPPQAAAAVVRECIALGIKRVWLHRSIGTGSASPEAVRIAHEAKLTLIPAGCPAMFLAPDVPHRCFRWFMSVTGQLPAQVGA